MLSWYSLSLIVTPPEVGGSPLYEMLLRMPISQRLSPNNRNFALFEYLTFMHLCLVYSNGHGRAVSSSELACLDAASQPLTSLIGGPLILPFFILGGFCTVCLFVYIGYSLALKLDKSPACATRDLRKADIPEIIGVSLTIAWGCSMLLHAVIEYPFDADAPVTVTTPNLSYLQNLNFMAGYALLNLLPRDLITGNPKFAYLKKTELLSEELRTLYRITCAKVSLPYPLAVLDVALVGTHARTGMQALFQSQRLLDTFIQYCGIPSGQSFILRTYDKQPSAPKLPSTSTLLLESDTGGDEAQRREILAPFQQPKQGMLGIFSDYIQGEASRINWLSLYKSQPWPLPADTNAIARSLKKPLIAYLGGYVTDTGAIPAKPLNSAYVPTLDLNNGLAHLLNPRYAVIQARTVTYLAELNSLYLAGRVANAQREAGLVPIPALRASLYVEYGLESCYISQLSVKILDNQILLYITLSTGRQVRLLVNAAIYQAWFDQDTGDSLLALCQRICVYMSLGLTGYTGHTGKLLWEPNPGTPNDLAPMPLKQHPFDLKYACRLVFKNPVFGNSLHILNARLASRVWECGAFDLHLSTLASLYESRQRQAYIKDDLGVGERERLVTFLTLMLNPEHRAVFDMLMEPALRQVLSRFYLEIPVPLSAFTPITMRAYLDNALRQSPDYVVDSTHDAFLDELTTNPLVTQRTVFTLAEFVENTNYVGQGDAGFRIRRLLRRTLPLLADDAGHPDLARLLHASIEAERTELATRGQITGGIIIMAFAGVGLTGSIAHFFKILDFIS